MDQYDTLYREFRWQVPAAFNIAAVCCSRWASDNGRIAIHYEDESGRTSTLTYAALEMEANRLSNILRRLGVAPGARVAIVLP
ncbi:MAG TPA: AMP-binding protein, partial [Oxalobacteraceae bacterium]|nr:AMP-binding protein [Oxalobacteraceae bacterium]